MQEQFRLAEMIHNLLKVDEETWGLYAFSRDLLNRRIPAEVRKEMITRAGICGKEYAQRIIRECGSSDTRTIAERLNLKIGFLDTFMTGKRVLFASYTSPDIIEIMEEPVHRAVSLISEEESIVVELFRQDGIITSDNIPVPNVVSAHQRHEVADAMGACEQGIMSPDIIPVPNVVSAHQRHEVADAMGACEQGIMSPDIIPVPNVVSAHQRHEVADAMGACEHGIMNTILGHEIFHFVEEQFEQEIYTRTEKIRLWSFMGFKNYSTIRALSEIGAMAFTKEINRLNFSPFILDILLYYSYDSSGAGKIYRDIIGMSSGRCRETVENY